MELLEGGLMSSKRRMRRRQCQNKKAYPSQNDAQAAITIMEQCKVALCDLHPYQCQFANHWHVGRQPKHLTGRIKAWQWSGEG